MSSTIFVLLLCFFSSLISGQPPNRRTPPPTEPMEVKPACVSSRTKVECTFVVAYAMINLNGMEKRLAAINGEFPGPVIRVKVGQRLVVKVTNKIFNRPFTIHWHGMHHRGQDVWMDGNYMVTQCPIGYDETFTYDFEIQDSQHPGTYIYHGHKGLNIDSGINGILIIDPANGQDAGYPKMCEEDGADPATCISGDFPMLLTDIIPQEATMSGEWTWPPFIGDEGPRGARIRRGKPSNNAAGVLINGRGQLNVNGTCHWAGQQMIGAVCDPENAPEPTTFEMEAGKRYLYRLVNGGFDEEVLVTFVNHNVTVIGNGNSRVLPSAERSGINQVMLAPGERAELIVELQPDVLPGPHLIYVETPPHFRHDIKGVGCALMTYGKRHMPKNYTFECPPYVLYEELPFERRGLNMYDYRNTLETDARYVKPSEQMPTADEVTKKLTLTAAREFYPIDPATGDIVNPKERVFYNATEEVYCPRDDLPPPAGFAMAIDGISNRNWGRQYGMTPMMMMSTMGDETFKDKTNFYHIEVGDVVQIVFRQIDRCGGQEYHPMHMHGYTLWIVGTGYGPFNETEFLENERNGKYKPFYADVFNNAIPPEIDEETEMRGWVVLRFRAKQAGIWSFHCHQIEHSLQGLHTFIGESLDQVEMPPEGFPVCGSSAKPLIENMINRQVKEIVQKMEDTHKRDIREMKDSHLSLNETESECPDPDVFGKLFHKIKNNDCKHGYGVSRKGKTIEKLKNVDSAKTCKMMCEIGKTRNKKIAQYKYAIDRKICYCYDAKVQIDRKATRFVLGNLDVSID